jgi:methyltransferase (TIGR00027 family)
MAEAVIQNVSDTAFWVAHYRGVESSRSDALFRDPLAAVLAGERGKNIAHDIPMGMMTQWIVAVRTVIIDDFLRQAVAEGADTILNLGAGLDTRPYRMELPDSLVWVEADYPWMVEFKERKLAEEKPRCQLRRVDLDLADATERRRVLQEVNASARKMVVLTEGVVPYLSEEEAAPLAEDLRALDHARYWIVDYFAPQVMKFRERRGMGKKMRNAPFKFAPQDWHGFFAQHGWQAKEIRYLTEEGNRLGRPIRLPVVPRMFAKMQGLWATKERRAAFQRFAGYVLLEPKSK